MDEDKEEEEPFWVEGRDTVHVIRSRPPRTAFYSFDQWTARTIR